MIRISKLADYAAVILAELARGHHGQPATLSAMAIAAATHLPETTVAKIMKTLARENLLVSSRGALGGYALARPASNISVLEMIEAVDGRVGIVDCTVDERADCQLNESCKLKSNWSGVNDTLRAALSRITLADMMAQTARKAA